MPVTRPPGLLSHGEWIARRPRLPGRASESAIDGQLTESVQHTVVFASTSGCASLSGLRARVSRCVCPARVEPLLQRDKPACSSANASDAAFHCPFQRAACAATAVTSSWSTATVTVGRSLPAGSNALLVLLAGRSSVASFSQCPGIQYFRRGRQPPTVVRAGTQ